MIKNEMFGNFRHGGTPFNEVHMAKSGEIVNELNSPVCSVEIDDIPQTIQTKNGLTIVICLNQHAALKRLEQAARLVFSEMATRIGAASFAEFSDQAKTQFETALSHLDKVEKSCLGIVHGPEIQPHEINDHHRKEVQKTRPS